MEPLALPENFRRRVPLWALLAGTAGGLLATPLRQKYDCVCETEGADVEGSSPPDDELGSRSAHPQQQRHSERCYEKAGHSTEELCLRIPGTSPHCEGAAA